MISVSGSRWLLGGLLPLARAWICTSLAGVDALRTCWTGRSQSPLQISDRDSFRNLHFAITLEQKNLSTLQSHYKTLSINQHLPCAFWCGRSRTRFARTHSLLLMTCFRPMLTYWSLFLGGVDGWSRRAGLYRSHLAVGKLQPLW